MPEPPGEVLDRARAAAKAGNDELALASYEHFFDNALKDQGDGHNYYGVRLSYCLTEWKRLGERYPRALQRLEVKADEAIEALERTRQSPLFHDYISINEHLGRERKSIDQFLSYHASDRPLAESVVSYIWDDLVDEGLWDICATYVPDPRDKYAHALEKYDVTMKMCNDDSTFGGERFAKRIARCYVRDVSNLCLVLKNSGDAAALTCVMNEMRADMTARARADLVEQVSSRVAL